MRNLKSIAKFAIIGISFIFLLILVYFVSIDPFEDVHNSQKNFRTSFQTGMSKQEIIKRFGEPTKMFSKNNADELHETLQILQDNGHWCRSSMTSKAGDVPFNTINIKDELFFYDLYHMFSVVFISFDENGKSKDIYFCDT
jgi:hypothetical protein